MIYSEELAQLCRLHGRSVWQPHGIAEPSLPQQPVTSRIRFTDDHTSTVDQYDVITDPYHGLSYDSDTGYDSDYTVPTHDTFAVDEHAHSVEIALLASSDYSRYHDEDEDIGLLPSNELIEHGGNDESGMRSESDSESDESDEHTGSLNRYDFHIHVHNHSQRSHSGHSDDDGHSDDVFSEDDAESSEDQHSLPSHEESLESDEADWDDDSDSESDDRESDPDTSEGSDDDLDIVNLE